jgi:RNA polymerase sigma factor (sigma-70 family)
MRDDTNLRYVSEEEMIEDLAGEAKMLARVFGRKWRGRIPPDDIYQTALLGAILAFRNYDAAQCLPMRNWICSKMRFAIYDLRRAEIGRNRTARNEGIHLSIDNCPQSYLAADGFRSVFARLDVERLIATVPPKFREIIRRRHLADESLAEIAAGKPVGISMISQIDRRGIAMMRASA